MIIYAIADRVLSYINHGFAPIPIEFQTKRPINPDWPKLSISEVTLETISTAAQPILGS